MSSITEPLILDLIEWIAREPRTYAEVMDAWRTSCPRLTVWEDAVDLGFVTTETGTSRSIMVVVTPQGREFLRAHGCRPAPTAVSPAAQQSGRHSMRA